MRENDKERLKDVAGTVNFRDLGGYRADGGSTKWGTLFRADALHRLSTPGHEALRGLGVRRVIDLRDERERRSAPDILPKDIELIEQAIFPDALSHVSKKLNIDSLTELIFFEHGKELTDAISYVAASSDPTIVHCTAGKDRTGAVVALTLSVVGVDRDDILHDYSKTQEYLKGEWLDNHLSQLQSRGMEITPEVLGLVSMSPLKVMEKSLKLIDQQFGSAIDYLRSNGLADASIEALHGNLVSTFNK